jgi:uncharacterized protein (TIGR03435 family)
MAKLADLLARQAGVQVVDATEWRGAFDFTLQLGIGRNSQGADGG